MAINLLPPAEKKELIKEKSLKKVFTILLFFLIALAFLILIFYILSSYSASKIDVSEKTLLNESLKDPEFKNFQKLAAETNQLLSQIIEFYRQQVLITPVFENLFSLTPNSIYFTNFSFQKNEGFQGEVYISGWAERREDVFQFKKNLESHKDFKNVYFLPSSWISPVNVIFSLNFQYQPNE